jgi:hypothetical protein
MLTTYQHESSSISSMKIVLFSISVATPKFLLYFSITMEINSERGTLLLKKKEKRENKLSMSQCALRRCVFDSTSSEKSKKKKMDL